MSALLLLASWVALCWYTAALLASDGGPVDTYIAMGVICVLGIAVTIVSEFTDDGLGIIN